MIQYRQKRMEEIAKSVPRFGKVLLLNVDNFVSAIEDENANVAVIF